MDDHHQIRGIFAHGDAQTFYFFRQARFGDRHAILHQDLRFIDVRSQGEHHIDRGGTVPRRL